MGFLIYYPTPAGGSLLVDSVTSQTAVFAFGLKKLRSAYSGNCIRVRRSSDNTEQDIGFSGNALDTASLTSFCASTNGFVTTVYDQMGGSTHMTNSTTADQPRIVNAGVYSGELEFNGTSSLLTASSLFGVNHDNTWTVFSELGSFTSPGSGDNRILSIGTTAGSRFRFVRQSTTTQVLAHRSGSITSAFTDSPTFATNDKLLFTKTSTTANMTSVNVRVNNGSDKAGVNQTVSALTPASVAWGGSGSTCGKVNLKVLVGWLGNITSDEITAIHAA